jgi:YVTN family beta-propeller protein
LGTEGDHIAFALDAVFVTEPGSRQLARIDPNDNRVTTVATFSSNPHGIASSPGTVWVSSSNAPEVFRTEPGATPDATKTTTIGVVAPLNEIAFGNQGLWGSGSKVVRVDPGTNAVAQQIEAGPALDSVAVGEAAVWVANRQPSGSVTRISPVTNTVVATIGVGSNPDEVAVGAGAVWVANSGNGTVSRIDPATDKVVATIATGGHPTWVVVGLGSLWVTDSSSGRVLRVDPATNKVTGSVTVGKNPEATATGAGNVWVVNRDDQTVSRIDPGS